MPDVNDPRWTDVDRYVSDRLAPADAALEAAVRASEAAGLPAIQVSAPQGRMLHVLARAVGARRILEIGTLGGYSTIWLARALPPDGALVTLEAEPRHAEVALANLLRAGVAHQVELRLGLALESLQRLEQERVAPFDLVFIDADKPNIPAYFDWALRLSRPGALILVDNVVRDGELANAASADPAVRGVRALVEQLAAERRVAATVVQTVGGKGYDGFAMAVVLPGAAAR
jgi:predicted O-methyltransferase YrrM